MVHHGDSVECRRVADEVTVALVGELELGAVLLLSESVALVRGHRLEEGLDVGDLGSAETCEELGEA